MAPKSLSVPSAANASAASGEIVVVRAAGEAPLLRRRGPTAFSHLTYLLAALVGQGATIDRHAFRKSLEARAPASVKALANDLSRYTGFSARTGGIGLPASEA